jgi:hypothetical protein
LPERAQAPAVLFIVVVLAYCFVLELLFGRTLGSS